MNAPRVPVFGDENDANAWKVAEIVDRLERYVAARESEDGDRHTRDPGFTIEDITKILNEEAPDR
jgi:hypothetical protein